MSAIPDPALSRQEAIGANSGAWLGVLMLFAVSVFAAWLVGTRSLETGTDTHVYAGFFVDLGQGPVESRMETGFVYLSMLLHHLGLGVTGYQAALFTLLLLGVLIATRSYHRYLGDGPGFQTLLCASLMLLFVSPMFVNASINAIRQGLAAPLVFTALLAFQQRRWLRFAVYGAIACNLHSSSAMYLAFAPLLLVKPKWLLLVAAAALAAYCSGISMLLVRSLAPSVYSTVMEYSAHSRYRAGVRIDFAVFSIFWYALQHLLAPLVRESVREQIRNSSSVYLVMLLPFFAVGWGYFSNRFLLPAWMSASLILAAILCYSRFPLLRSSLLIRCGLLASCGVFYFLVTRVIVI